MYMYADPFHTNGAGYGLIAGAIEQALDREALARSSAAAGPADSAVTSIGRR
jgi:hypothetical protein